MLFVADSVLSKKEGKEYEEKEDKTKRRQKNRPEARKQNPESNPDEIILKPKKD